MYINCRRQVYFGARQYLPTHILFAFYYYSVEYIFFFSAYI